MYVIKDFEGNYFQRLRGNGMGMEPVFVPMKDNCVQCYLFETTGAAKESLDEYNHFHPARIEKL